MPDDLSLNAVPPSSCRYEDFFVNHMMTEELGMMPPEPKGDVFKGLLMNSLVMFTAFLVFGIIPLLS
jgi:DNA damage-binding protein 1